MMAISEIDPLVCGNHDEFLLFSRSCTCSSYFSIFVFAYFASDSLGRASLAIVIQFPLSIPTYCNRRRPPWLYLLKSLLLI